jgi:hypothetical protein
MLTVMGMKILIKVFRKLEKVLKTGVLQIHLAHRPSHRWLPLPGGILLIIYHQNETKTLW